MAIAIVCALVRNGGNVIALCIESIGFVCVCLCDEHPETQIGAAAAAPSDNPTPASVPTTTTTIPFSCLWAAAYSP